MFHYAAACLAPDSIPLPPGMEVEHNQYRAWLVYLHNGEEVPNTLGWRKVTVDSEAFGWERPMLKKLYEEFQTSTDPLFPTVGVEDNPGNLLPKLPPFDSRWVQLGKGSEAFEDSSKVAGILATSKFLYWDGKAMDLCVIFNSNRFLEKSDSSAGMVATGIGNKGQTDGAPSTSSYVRRFLSVALLCLREDWLIDSLIFGFRKKGFLNTSCAPQASLFIVCASLWRCQL